MSETFAPADSRFSVIVKPNSPKTEILEYDPLKIAIKAAPEKGKANQELIRFLSKKLKKKVIIVSGLKSHKKILELV